MAGQDGTGPNGMGPMTGRGLGPCGRGMAFRRGAGMGYGQGFGRGFGRGRKFAGMGWGRGMGYWQLPAGFSKEEEKKILEEELQYLEDEMKDIKEYLKELKEDAKKESQEDE